MNTRLRIVATKPRTRSTIPTTAPAGSFLLFVDGNEVVVWRLGIEFVFEVARSVGGEVKEARTVVESSER